MPIERDPEIQFHPRGTLEAVTRWIAGHADGLAEWAKNARRAYQPDRADVPEEQRSALILLQDTTGGEPARLGFLDVGGATFEDVQRWTVWQDPEASWRSRGVEEEQTQGNGGKAYMYRLFRGPAYILGVSEGRRNCKGFEGESGTLERGTPGFIPDAEEGREFPVEDVAAEVDRVLAPYHLALADLPEEIGTAIVERQAFTLVEGIDPREVYQGRLDAERLTQDFLRHDQNTLVLEQLRVFSAHNGEMVNDGHPLEREPILPFPDLEGPFVFEIPSRIPDEDGVHHSSTDDGRLPSGKVMVFTSKDNMYTSWKRLRPRWRVTYRTRRQAIGSKPITDVVPPTPGYQHVYAAVELDALDEYATHGRARPREGPLVNAVDEFVAERVREIAREISELSRQELNEKALDEVHRENERLDRWKNRFLEAAGAADGGSREGPGHGRRTRKGTPVSWGDVVETIELEKADTGVQIGVGVRLNLATILKPVLRDYYGNPVRGLNVEWLSSDRKIVDFRNTTTGQAIALRPGKTKVRVRLADASVVSLPVPVEVWGVDHVLLSPRKMDVLVGLRRQITAEVTDKEGRRSTDVLLNWRHEAEDPMVVRIRPTGWVTGNRVGTARVLAGSGDPGEGVWSTVGTEVQVLANPDNPGPGEGFPRLLLTGRDLDPETGEVREGDPEQPTLWQEVSDVRHNIWWLNLEAPDARFAFSRFEDDPHLWRQFHSYSLTQMVKQAHMLEEYTRRGEQEPPASWAEHKAALERFEIRLLSPMWETLQEYILTGEGIE